MKMKNKYDKYLNRDINFERFKEFVRESKVGTLNPDTNIQQAILGLIGEWGEVADILKKHIFQGHKIDKDHLIEELGDCCWYGMLLIDEAKLDTVVESKRLGGKLEGIRIVIKELERLAENT